VANQLWHLKRLERWEGALLAMEQAKVEPELAHLLTERAQRQGIPNPRGWTNEEQLEDEILLMGIRQTPLEKVADQADKVPFPLEVAQDLLRALLTMEGLEPADAPNPVQAMLRSTRDSTLTTGPVLKVVQALAAAVGKEVPKMLRKLAKDARARKAVLRELKAWASTQRSLRQEIHLVPDAEHAERLMRYRTHFTRQLHQALHELEAMQARRRGEPTPLARIDVQGVPEVLSGFSDAIGRSSTRGDRSGVDLAQASANGSSTVVSEGSAG
jgi:23S rRNA C2498 (ribose-2'-O)-methylase RlmM